MGRTKVKEAIKLSKTYKLHFKGRNEFEEIVKSSNNREDGMIKTYSATAKKFKEYTVNFIMNYIEMGLIDVIKPETKA